MHMFIDEGGTFVPATGWGVVCSLALPHKEVGPARREVERTSADWPRKATVAAGIEVHRVEIDKGGKIILVTTKPPEQTLERTGVNEWDSIS